MRNAREQLEHELWAEDADEKNHSYRTEQALLQLVINGEPERVRRACETMFPAYPNVTDFQVRKNEEYMAVITIALAARAVIGPGITSAESFRMSDRFLHKISRASYAGEIIQIRNEALVSFAEYAKRKKRAEMSHPYVEDAKNYIAAHIYKKISLRDIAKELHVSDAYLERIFREQEGKTIGDYIIEEKIGRAENLLKYSDRSILEIAEYLGFSSQSRFGDYFKRVTGETPAKYRKAHKAPKF